MGFVHLDLIDRSSSTTCDFQALSLSVGLQALFFSKFLAGLLRGFFLIFRIKGFQLEAFLVGKEVDRAIDGNHFSSGFHPVVQLGLSISI